MSAVAPTNFSDYIIFVDESGDHGLESINQDYPLFCLSFCIFEKNVYAEQVTPALRSLKLATFGHDLVILHEHDIRKKTGAFSLLSKEPRERFLEALTQVIDQVTFTLVAVVIDKQRLKNHYANPAHPYHLAMEFGLERAYRFLRSQGQEARITHIVFEARGKNEDAALELEFRRVRDGDNYFGTQLPFEILIADKRTNSEGLQLADMTARPIALSVLRPAQSNRAAEVLEKKFYRDDLGKKDGFGLKVFPEKTQGP